MTLTISVAGGSATPPSETISPGQFAIGVNLSGMEYAKAGSVQNKNYVVPSLSELQYYKSQGTDLIRLPISWEALQTTLNGPLTASYLANIETVLADAASLGMKVIIDLHDYGGYSGTKIGAPGVTDAEFANLWQQLSAAVKGSAGLAGYDLMNEPSNMPSATAWTSAAQAAITAIRTEDTATPIYVEGNDYSNAQNWSNINPGFTTLYDPSNNLIFSAHVYLDSGDSGTKFDWTQQAALGTTTQTGVNRLEDFVGWLKQNNLKGDIGEIGVGNDNAEWLVALDNTLAYAKANNLQTTYWAGGAWWGNYPMSVEPYNGIIAPQMAVLEKYSGDYSTVSSVQLSGSAAANSVVYLSQNAILLGEVTANASGNWSDTLTGLPKGVNTIVAGTAAPTADGTIAAVTFNVAALRNAGTDVALCYLRGTRILTEHGEICVEDLRIGNLVAARSGGLRPIKWIGRQRYSRRFITRNRKKIPVRIRAGSLSPNLPTRDLFISPGHSMLLGDTLVFAHALVNGVTITQDVHDPKIPDEIEYFHIELDSHDCLMSEGAWSEAFADAPGLRAPYDNAADFYALYPNAPAPSELRLCAPRPESGLRLDLALRPVVARAAAAQRNGPVVGFIDHLNEKTAAGWAYDLHHPQLPVLLLVWVDNRLIGTRLACDYRADLEAAGKGSGRCAFTFEIPVPLSPKQMATLQVLSASDRTALPRTLQTSAALLRRHA